MPGWRRVRRVCRRPPGGAGARSGRSGALRARARRCARRARRARACWREARTRAGAVSGRQAGSGIARSRTSAAASCPAQGQCLGRCRVQRPTTPWPTPSPATSARWPPQPAWSCCTRGPTVRKRTARPSASSRSCRTSGRTPARTVPTRSGYAHSLAGSTATIVGIRTAASAGPSPPRGSKQPTWEVQLEPLAVDSQAQRFETPGEISVQDYVACSPGTP